MSSFPCRAPTLHRCYRPPPAGANSESHRLDEIDNHRLQRLKTKTMGYNFTTKWLKGALNNAPDALSRNPASDLQPHEMLAESDIDNSIAISSAEIRAMTDQNHESLRLQDQRKIAEDDPQYQRLKHYIVHGFPKHRRQLPTDCRRYWNVRHNLSIKVNLILLGCRLLIPTEMRRDILSQLHESHQGMIHTKERARLVVYWPGFDNEIDNIIYPARPAKTRTLPSNHRELITCKRRPSRPFQAITADCYTDWPDIVPVGTNTTTAQLVSALKASFCRTSVPDGMWTDQGPQFTSKSFQDFNHRWGFTHTTSSPRYPQSNGKAEATVKSMKKIIRAAWTGRHLDDDKLTRALLQYCNTPSHKDGQSPAQKLFGHPIQDTLPAHR